MKLLDRLKYLGRIAKSDASHRSPDGRATKRHKSSVADDAAIAIDDTKSSCLPPELWARVCDFLPYDSLLQTAAVSREMLLEVMPRVTMLHIDKSCHLHAGVTHRYGDVQDIYIYSLIEFDFDLRQSFDCHLNEDTLARALPFLCRFTSCLERVFLGGRRPNYGSEPNNGKWRDTKLIDLQEKMTVR